MGILLRRWGARGSQATRELLFLTLCHLTHHLSPLPVSWADDCSANTCIPCTESGINHPAREESLFPIFADRHELSLSSRWNFNIQQDSRELKRKTVSVQPPARAFYFWGNWLVLLCTCIGGSGGSRWSSGLCGGVRVTLGIESNHQGGRHFTTTADLHF